MPEGQRARGPSMVCAGKKKRRPQRTPRKELIRIILRSENEAPTTDSGWVELRCAVQDSGVPASRGFRCPGKRVRSLWAAEVAAKFGRRKRVPRRSWQQRSNGNDRKTGDIPVARRPRRL